MLAPREEYLLFDLGDLKGVLQRDRVILIGADRPAATALADELRQRLVIERDDMELERETPFEVRSALTAALLTAALLTTAAPAAPAPAAAVCQLQLPLWIY